MVSMHTDTSPGMMQCKAPGISPSFSRCLDNCHLPLPTPFTPHLSPLFPISVFLFSYSRSTFPTPSHSSPSLSFSLPPTSPCGKKFRSKPQIARFLGDSADLTVFDFSRAGTPGDGSSRRRARDRTARRAVDVSKYAPPPIRPLSINPLRPSGPIRRTCGVIKLPVTWVAPPSDEQLKLTTTKTQEEAPPSPVPMEQDALPSQPAVPQANTSSSSQPGDAPNSTLPTSQILPQPPTLLQETQQKKTTPPPTMGGSAESAAKQAPSVQQPAPKPSADQPLQQPQQKKQSHLPPPTSSSSIVMMPALWENRLRGVTAHDHETGTAIRVNLEKLHNGLNHSATPNTAVGAAGGGLGAGGNISEATSVKGALSEIKLTAASLDKPVLNALLSKQLGKSIVDDKKILPVSSTGGVIPSLLAAHRKSVVTSGGGGVITSSASAGGGSSLNIQENGSLSGAKSKGSLASNIVLTFPSVVSANPFNKTKQGITAAVVSAAQRQAGKGSGLVVTAAGSVPNGPSLPASSTSLYVSESEVRIQEEKVKLLRKQLMAAQSTV